MNETTLQTLYRELLASHDQEASAEELQDFMAAVDISPQLHSLAADLASQWQAWKAEQASQQTTVPTPEQTMIKPIFFKVPNAMVNIPYAEKIIVEGDLFEEIIKIEGLEAAGLTYDSASHSLSGTPLHAGEFKFNVTYFSTSGGSAAAVLPFVVNHDPKSLWRNIPSDSTVKFWKEDEAAQGMEGHEHWHLIGASKRGRSHAHEGKCRDDDFAFIADHPQQWHILAVSDGAGSSQYSREGARLAVQVASTVLAEKLTEHHEALLAAITAWDETAQQSVRQLVYTVFSQAIYAAINTIHQSSKKEQGRFRDFYATLLLAAHREVAGKHFVVGYWIGDGGMAVYTADQEIHLLGQPDSGEYAGQTRFLDPEANSGEDINQRLRFTLCDSMTALVLMTDGITDPLFETDYNLAQSASWHRFWHEIVQPQLVAQPDQSANNLLNWLDFWSPGNHDDRTLALLSKGNPEP